MTRIPRRLRGDFAAALGGLIGAIACIPASSVVVQLFITLFKPADDVLESFVQTAVPVGVSAGTVIGCWVGLKMQGFARCERTGLILAGLLIPGWAFLFFLSSKTTEWFLLIAAALMFGMGWLARNLSRDRNIVTHSIDRARELLRSHQTPNARQQNPAHQINSGVK